jgi:hypothetical protein
MEAKDFFDILKNIATTFALAAGGGYFIWKARSGYQIINVKLSLATSRSPIADSTDRDHLSISATFAKGDRGSVFIEDAQVRVKPATEVAREMPLAGVERLSNQAITKGTRVRHQVLWNTRSEDSPFLNLTPGEETQFGCYIDVPRDQPCSVEVVFLGHRPSSTRIGQWRASGVSMPSAPDRKASA